jgi:hypothetical protein
MSLKFVDEQALINHGLSWTRSDIELLHKLFLEHKSFDEISTILKRSSKSIEIRYQIYIYRLINEGKTLTDIAKLLNLKLDDVNDYCKKELLRQERNKNKDNNSTSTKDDMIQIIEDMTRIKKLLQENDMKKEVEELDAQIKLLLKDQLKEKFNKVNIIKTINTIK